MKHPMFSGVYAIVHIASGRRYIGSARNIYRRWREHKSCLRRGVHCCPRLQNAWNKYGPDAFRFEVVESCLKDPVLLCHREELYLKQFAGNIYNSRMHADPSFGVPCSPERKAALSKRMQGNRHGEGTHYHGHLTEEDVRAILARYASGESRESLAAAFGTDPTHVSRIASRRIWWRVEVSPEIEAACRERTKCRARGAANAKAKLTTEQVHEIRRLLAAGVSGPAIGRQFNVTSGAIYRIKNGLSYGYLGGPATGASIVTPGGSATI